MIENEASPANNQGTYHLSPPQERTLLRGSHNGGTGGGGGEEFHCPVQENRRCHEIVIGTIADTELSELQIFSILAIRRIANRAPLEGVSRINGET